MGHNFFENLVPERILGLITAPLPLSESMPEGLQLGSNIEQGYVDPALVCTVNDPVILTRRPGRGAPIHLLEKIVLQLMQRLEILLFLDFPMTSLSFLRNSRCRLACLKAFGTSFAMTCCKFVMSFILSAGTMFLMWVGDQITERGIGNGTSLIITVGIVASQR
jgi:hypothetical protein